MPCERITEPLLCRCMVIQRGKRVALSHACGKVGSARFVENYDVCH